MWSGGVRVIVIDDNERMLVVKQHHEGRDIWMVPGGSIEEGEYGIQAAVREIKEETGLDVRIDRFLWHVEEVSERGQRFVSIYLAFPEDPSAVPCLGTDPELGEEQVLREVRYMTREEIAGLENFYPEPLRGEFWEMWDEGLLDYDAFRLRNRSGRVKPHMINND